MKVYAPFQDEFPYEECKSMYEDKQSLIGDDSPFEKVITDTIFFAFINDDELYGCIYYYKLDDGHIYVNGFAGEKHHADNITWLKWTLSGFKSDIYAKSFQRPAILCLLRAGFKKIGENLFRYERT